MEIGIELHEHIPHLYELIELLKERGLHTCILYGSAASGRMRSGSDIDLAVAGREPLAAEYLARLNTEISTLLGREVDIHDLRRARAVYLKEILMKGEILLNEEPDFLGEKAIEMMDYQSSLAAGVDAMLKRRIVRCFDGI